MKELSKEVKSGGIMLIISFIIIIVATASFAYGIVNNENALFLTVGILLAVVFFFMLPGFFTIQPNEAVVLVLFGKYVGTVKKDGWHWSNPFYTKKKISLRSRNLNGEKLKVNDEVGNPIEIAAVIVWRVQNTAEALFDVENYSDYVKVQRQY